MRRFLTETEFSRLAGESQSPDLKGAAVYRFATATADIESIVGRKVPYKFSGGGVARDGHTINQRGWQLANFLANPVFLWGHDDGQPPIGKVTDIGVGSDDWLRGVVEYPTADVYPFADMIFRMVKAGYINAVSTSWLPIAWKMSNDRSRPGGIDFLEQELLEISQVTLPAQADALAEARSAGIDTTPMFEWASRALDLGGFATIDRRELEALRKAALTPAARRAPRPPSIKPSGGGGIAQHEDNMGKKQKFTPPLQRGLSTVSDLSYAINWLAYLQRETAGEAECEGDNSPIPGRLADAIADLGNILVDMTKEEVAELVGMLKGQDGVSEAVEQSMTSGQRAIYRILRSVPAPAAEPDPAQQLATAIEPVTRAGKKISRANADKLQEALAHCQSLSDCVQSVLDQADADDDDKADTAADELVRARKAKALKHRARAVSAPI